MSDPQRSTWTALTDAQLLAQCAVDTYRASGPGGQKRNKTSSAVRLRHPGSGLIVIAEESRSQHENRARALRRLRQALYLKLREPIPAADLTPEHLASRPDYRPAPTAKAGCTLAAGTRGSGRPSASCSTCWRRWRRGWRMLPPRWEPAPRTWSIFFTWKTRSGKRPTRCGRRSVTGCCGSGASK